MDISPDLIARSYAVLEYFYGLTEEVGDANGGNNFNIPSPKAISENDLKDFIEQLKALDDEEEGGSGSQKGLRGHEQMREVRELSARRTM